MNKIRFKEYPNGTWEDWSQYLITPPQVNKRVESDKPGESGLIVYDDAELELRKETGNPVYNKFEKDLTSVQKYLFEIYCPNSLGQQRKLFEGIADFGTLDKPKLSNTLRLSLKDKLSALQFLETKPSRTSVDFMARLGNPYYDYPNDSAPLDVDAIKIYGVNGQKNRLSVVHGEYTMYQPYPGDPATRQWQTQAWYPGDPLTFLPGEILSVTAADGTTINYLITDSWIAKDGGGQSVSNELSFIVLDTDGNYVEGDIVCYSKQFYGAEIGVYDSSSGRNVLVAYDGLAISLLLAKQQWTEIQLVNRTGSSTFPIPLEFYVQLMDENPFDTDPYEALKFLADSMKSWIFTNRSGNLVIQSRKQIGNNGVTRSLNNTVIFDGSDKYAWDKISDGVDIKVKSWVTVNGEYLEGSASLSKTRPGYINPIKPKNPISKTILASTSVQNTEEALNACAAQVAEDYLEFYGLRHSSMPAVLDLDDNILGIDGVPDDDPASGWDMLDDIILDGESYFWPRMSYDLVARTVEIEFVNVTGNEYYPGQMSVPSGTSSSSSSLGGGSSSGGSSPSSYDTRYWSGSPVGLDAALGRQSLGLNNIANLGTGAVSTAEFNYLQGLTGNIQTQLNTLNADRHTHPNIAELNSVDQNLSKLNSV
ncbi:MAG TPA: hypothetical protein VHO03_17355, partial [Ignavibacteriales bacterium]|nr:hypothetical protein [Ignavibacteriales bacterium]